MDTQPQPQLPSQHRPDGTLAADPEPDAIEAATPWLEDLDELPPRPRRRLLSPAPLALLGVLLTACGFIAGVLVEKGQGGSSFSSPAGAFASRLRAAASGARRGGTSAASTGFPGLGSGARPTSGTVAYLAGGTLYLTDSEGATVKVKTSAATSVSKTSSTSVHAIRPGETVTVTGSTAGDGTVTAEAIRVGSAGNGLAALFGSGGATGGSGGAGGASSAGPALFGNG